MRSAHNGTDYGSIPCGLIIRIIVKGTWSSLVYGTYLENKNFSKSREFKSHSIRIIITDLPSRRCHVTTFPLTVQPAVVGDLFAPATRPAARDVDRVSV